MATEDSLDAALAAYHELMLRLSSVEQNIMIYVYLNEGDVQIVASDSCGYSVFEELLIYKETIQSVLLTNSILQFSAVLDQQGTYSLHLNNGILSKKRLQRLFPNLCDDELQFLRIKLNLLFKKFRHEIIFMKDFRNAYIAHLGKKRVGTHLENPDWRYVLNFDQLILPADISLSRIMKLCGQIKYIISCAM